MTGIKKTVGRSSYREVQAWVFVVVNCIVMSFYGAQIFAGVSFEGGEGLPAVAGLIIVTVCTSLFTILFIIPTAIVFNRTANEKADERDKRIHIESRAIAFWPLFLFTSFALVGYVLHNSGELLFHSVMFAILWAQLIYAVVCAVKYRRSGAPLLAREPG